MVGTENIKKEIKTTHYTTIEREQLLLALCWIFFFLPQNACCVFNEIERTLCIRCVAFPSLPYHEHFSMAFHCCEKNTILNVVYIFYYGQFWTFYRSRENGMNPGYQLPGFNSYQIITNFVTARLPSVNHLEANYRYHNLGGKYFSTDI